MPEEMTLCNIDLIEGSPWQSRSTMDMVKLVELQSDIYTSRLHQPVVLRTVKGGYTDPDDPDSWTSVVYETVSGHRRVEAFRQLHKRGWQLNGKGYSPGPGVKEYWCGEKVGTLIPAIIEEMTDAEAARTILSENRMREDVNVMDEIRAVRRALDGTNVSAHDLAVSLGISDQQISNRLRLLRLPEGLQDCVGAGKLAWTTARELLAFVGADCDHYKELAFVERQVQDYAGAMPISTLQQHMASARTRWPEKWRRLTGQFEHWMDDYDEPLFDVEEFKRDHKYWIHTLPLHSHQNSGNRIFTCAVEEFDRLQAEGKRAIAEVEAIEASEAGTDEDEDVGVSDRKDSRSGPSEAELREFEAIADTQWDEWDEAIKGMYDRLSPVVDVMDDGIVERLLGGMYDRSSALRTWIKSPPGVYSDDPDDFHWRHGWHVNEIAFVFGLVLGAPQERMDWQLGRSSELVLWNDRVTALNQTYKREVLRLVLSAVNAVCIGRCGDDTWPLHVLF